ncbi:MAG: prepilin-type cleavage/methylation domain-containing protein [Sideroxyarcus sp.]|nr:prepilin-type cleavage/methylation domain-containing protein [Sideroxyarcus sp.]
MKRISFSSPSAQQGVVLIEAMVAILLFAVGVLAIAGLQAAMVKNSSDSKFRAEASYRAQQKIGEMWANPGATLAGFYNVVTPIAELPNGTITVVAPAVPNQFVITVGWQQPGQDPHQFTTFATITPCPPGIFVC